ncbi:hypothetical protein Sjap_018224 [Stephania japonica]|uniref:Uncharacterized protein n=1 Tax=Stephania japonica TaxID=461633 RepID=A0AAP0I7M2_9MAGN
MGEIPDESIAIGSKLLIENLDAIDRLIADGEANHNKFRHPDPYIGQWSFTPLRKDKEME